MTLRYARLLRFGPGVLDDLTPRLVRAHAIDNATVEVAFNTPMLLGDGTALADAARPSAYTITGPSTITVENLALYTPTRVRLRVSEMILGATYTLSVASALNSAKNRPISAPLSTAFVGLATLPTIVDANPLLSSEGDNLRVRFSAPMANNAALTALASYGLTSFSNATPLTVLAVTPEATTDPTYVDLTVSPMDNGGHYAISAVGLADAAGNALDPAQAPVAFVGYRKFVHPTVTAALPLSHQRVRLQFSAPMYLNSALLTPQNYVASGGLQVIGVAEDGVDAVVLETTPQVGDKEYRITANATLQNVSGSTLDEHNNAAVFVGVAPPTPLVVRALKATTHPDGRRIDLRWQNPEVPFTHIKIIRRTRGVPFDAQDGTPIFEGVGQFDQYSDSADLQDNTFYYYAVLLSNDGSTYRLDANYSTAECLSIRVIRSAEWIRHNALPSWVQERAGTLTPGLDLLEPVIRTLGAAVDLMRGELEAYRFSSDQDAGASSLLPAYNRTLHFEPEASFDMVALRRLPLHLLSIYKAKGTLPGLLSLVKVLTQWNCEIVEFGDAQGGSLLRTYDGLATLDRGFGTAASLELARGVIKDPAKNWPEDKWQGGRVEDSMGHVIHVEGSDAQTLVLSIPGEPLATVNDACPAGSRVLRVNDTSGFRERSYLQVSDTTHVQVAQVKTLTADDRLELQEPLQHSFNPGAVLHNLTDILDAEVVGTATASGATLTDPHKVWVHTQWNGYTLLASNNQKYVIKNTGANSVTVSGTPPPGAYAIAKDFILGATFSARQPVYHYTVYAGAHNLTFEPLHDLTLSGTTNDPDKRTYAGLTSLGAGFTNDDIAIFVQRGVAPAVGRVTGVELVTLRDDSGAFVPHSLQGLYLNPNRKQTQLFKIIDNDAHSIRVNRSMAGLVDVGDFYFVLNERNALKYNRLNAVLPGFIPRFTRAFVAFT